MNPRRFTSKPLAVSCLLLLMMLTAVLLPPGSKATRQNPTSENNATSKKRQRPEFVPGEALVRFKPNRVIEGQMLLSIPAADSTNANSDFTTQAAGQIPIAIDRFEGSDIVDGLRIARVAPDQTWEAIVALKSRDDVIYAEPNYNLHGETTPNDPSFNQLYAMNLIGAPQAWDLTQGNRNIVVAVIDEGIDIAHPDLQANIWTNPTPGSILGISGDLHGYDFINNSGTIPAELHATHVAGTIGAEGNNAQGVAGVNWRTSLMSLRFISAATNSGTEADSIRAYNYVKQMRDLWASSSPTKGANIRAVNASYGGGGYSQASADAINALGQSGVLFVAAAGNDATNSDLQHSYPSGYSLPNVISVAATTAGDSLAGFSNFGAQTVLMGAPGAGIFSTLPANQYGFLSGTSMATPHVTGAAALLCAQNPKLNVNQLRALLAFNGDLVPALQGKTITGRRLNVFKSLQASSEGDTTPPGTVTNLQMTSQNGRSVNLSWTASGDDGAAGQASLYEVSFIDQSTSSVIPLTSVAPAASGSAQFVNVKIPFRHLAGTVRIREFDNVGNEGASAAIGITVPLNAADPYTTALNSPAGLSTGGTALGLTADDRYRENFSLPFSFPFFGQSYAAVTISTNGNLYFSTPPKRSNGDADDVPSSVADLSLRKMIAGMWEDLDLSTSRRADADVYTVTPDATRIIFRWQGVQFDTGDPVNFEIELKNDGTITTRYGSGNTNLNPVVGISGGEPDPYTIDSLTSETSPKTLTNAQSAVFTPRSTCTFGLTPTSQTFGANGGTSSINLVTQNGCAWTATSNAPWIAITSGGSGTTNGTVNYSVAANPLGISRTGSITLAGLTFNVTEDPATIQFSQPAFLASENNPQAMITVTRLGDASLPASVAISTSDGAGSQACNVMNGNASSRCDYESVSTTINFAAGEASKTIGVSIINDTYQEGNETFTVTLSNASGAALGALASVPVTINDNDNANGTNPLSQTDFFVRQQYLDFLNREPDTSGFNFWINNIDQCGSDVGCREVRRIDTSAAFFLSIEFKETGYLVERIYKTSYGDGTGNSSTGGTHNLTVPVIRFSEFLTDTQRIGQGVIVNQPGWESVLEANKVAYFNSFVQSSRFTTTFPSSMTPTAFVDKLNDNAKDKNGTKPLSASESAQLIANLTNASMTRAQVLRAVAEDQDLANSEFNRAFVLMEYFGYLRRNPFDPPEVTLDYAGYEFWLNKLNQFNGNYINAEMVKAFLSSTEYGQRFAQ
jgi:subtilisin family serine protease